MEAGHEASGSHPAGNVPQGAVHDQGGIALQKRTLYTSYNGRIHNVVLSLESFYQFILISSFKHLFH